MKSTLNIKPQPRVEHTFPALYKSTTSDLVVFASGIETGTVVVGDSGRPVGEHYTLWSGFDLEAYWQRLPSGSSVTLTQD
jgi:hypothetical protein